MKKRIPIFTLVLAGAFAACGDDVEEGCETLCKKSNSCGLEQNQSDCVNDCAQDFDDTSDECKESFRELSSCLSTVSCEDLTDDGDLTSCVGEAFSFYGDCGEDLGMFTSFLPSFK